MLKSFKIESCLRNIQQKSLQRSSKLINFTQNRFKSKIPKTIRLEEFKYIKNHENNTATEAAKKYFDTNYSKQFSQSLWRSMRCALLSRKKYCTLLNNNKETEEYELSLKAKGAYDIIEKMKKKSILLINDLKIKIEKTQAELYEVENIESDYKTSIQSIKLFSKLEKLEAELSTIKSMLHCQLKVYTFARGDFSEFEDPTEDDCSFLFDPASLLPVLLLNPNSTDSILDVCSFPGEKLSIMSQLLSHGAYNLVANDISKENRKNLQKSMNRILPEDVISRLNLKFTNFDGEEWYEGGYSKILVDVPSTEDRTSLYFHEDQRKSIFHRSRKREINALPGTQMTLLRNAILACADEGTVVYATNSCSSFQNDFIVDHVIQELWEEFEVEVKVHSLESFINMFSEEFNFITSSKDVPSHGVLIYPTLASNVGPVYISKLTRKSKII